ncbi:MAG: hypothetical protein KDB82_18475 [Planctomycetes bacterium]|nr:hypothetical protein [Planctomycetota bacterium]
MKAQESSRSYLLLGLIVLIAGASLGIWLALQGGGHLSITAPAISNQPGSDTPPKALPLADNTPSRPVPAHPESKSPILALSTLTITFLEYQGARKVGVSGLEVQVRNVDRDDQQACDTFITDELGRLTKEVRSNSTWSISLKSESWRFTSLASGPHDSPEIVYVRSGSTKCDLLVEQVSSDTVEVFYDDGVPYSGLIQVSATGGPVRGVLVSEGKPLTLTLPSRHHWTLFVASRRPGFSGAKWELGRTRAEETSRIVLPRSDDTSGVFQVVCANFPTDAIVDIRISWRGESVSASTLDEIKDWPASQPYASKALSPGTYNVRVQISGHPGSVGSQVGFEVAELQARQIQTVRVALVQTGSIRVVILGEDKAPLSKARLAKSTSVYFRWGRTRDEPPGYQHPGSYIYSLSDDNGVALLSGLPLGPFDVLCDAEGYAQVILNANVMSGQECDLGTVQLTKALGSIRIEIIHPEAANTDEYEVTLLKPLAGIVRSAQRFSGKSHQIDGLNLLTYVVSIRYLPGGYGAYSKEVTLSAESPQATVTFEMQKPPLRHD